MIRRVRMRDKRMPVKKRPRGRPPLAGKILRTVILTHDLDAKARRIGGGKLSPGVRECIERAMTERSPGMATSPTLAAVTQVGEGLSDIANRLQAASSVIRSGPSQSSKSVSVRKEQEESK